jgi:hypothetical protein
MPSATVQQSHGCGVAIFDDDKTIKSTGFDRTVCMWRYEE